MVEPKIITKEYLKEVDEALEMIPLTFDVVLKAVFVRNLDLLKRFIIDVLNLDIDPDKAKIRLSNNELPKENTSEYQKRVDILVIINNFLHVDIEANRGDFRKVKNRNQIYLDKLHTMILETGDNIKKLNDIFVYQLNLNKSLDDSVQDIKEDEIYLYSKATQEKYLDNKVTYIKSLDYFRKDYYTNGMSLTDGDIWLASLTAKTFTELNEMLSRILNDKDRSRLVREAIRMSKSNFVLSEWESEKMEELVREESRRIDHDDGFNEGIEQGIEQKTIDVIKSMLSNNLDLEIISNVTGKTKEEIEKIKSDMSSVDKN